MTTSNAYLMLDLKTPHEAQKRVLRSAAKRKIVRGGRRGGKTTLAATLAVEKFAAGHRVLYAAPQLEQTDAFWREMKAALAPAVDARALKKNETERTIEVEGTQQRIRCKTAWNADSLRGDYADVLILDEYQLMNEDAWEFVGAPMLLDNDGDALFIYTPPSLHARSITKARDPRHAARMFARAAKDRSGRWLAVHFASDANPWISKLALAEIAGDMTQLAYRQEILAEDIDEIPGALWKQSLLDSTRVERDRLPVMQRIVVGVDPSGSAGTEAGIIACGLDREGHRYTLADRSLLAPSPAVWASTAVLLYHELRADLIVGERNYGGDMVEATIRQVDPNVAYHDVVATRGKLVRAQPIAASFERGNAHLVGVFEALEGELCSYVPGALSPNRLDAMVWAMTELEPSGGQLGLIDWLKGGGLRTLLELKPFSPAAAPTQPAPSTTDTAPVVTAVPDHGPCDACGYARLQELPGGNQLRCQQCGKQSWVDGRRPEVVVGRRNSASGIGVLGRWGDK